MSTHKVKAAITGICIAAMAACTVCNCLPAGAYSGNSYKNWLQKDSGWSSLRLGTSNETVGQSGCAVTSAAMLMVRSGSVTDENFSPAELVKCINNCGGFNAQACLDFHKLSRYTPSFYYCQKRPLSGTKQQKTAEMERLMADGYYLMAVVNNGQHFVAIDTIEGSKVIMMDPGSKATSLFEHYASAGVNELRLFKGANSPNNNLTEEPAVTPPAPTELIAFAEETELPAPPAPTELPEADPETPSFDILTTEPEEPAPETPPAPAEDSLPPATPPAPAEPESTAAEPETCTPDEDTPETPPMPDFCDESVSEPEDTPPTPPMPAEEPQTSTAPKYIPATFRLHGQKLSMKVQLSSETDLVLYAAPDVKANSLLTIPADTELPLIEADEACIWAKTAYGGKEGWICLTPATT